MGAPQPDKMQKSWLLDPRRKTLEHFVELALVIAALTLTGVYLNMGIRPTRSEIMIIPIVRRTPIENRGNRFRTIRKLMRRQLRRESNPSSSSATKLLSEHTARFSRWRSLKANAILNSLEVVFWLAAIIVKFMGVSRACSGNSCAVNCIILLVALSTL